MKDLAAVEPPEHVVQFYESDSFLADSVGTFLISGLRDSEAVIVLATPEHRADIKGRLQSDGFDPARLQADGRYLERDAAKALAAILVDGNPERERFDRLIGDALRHAERFSRRVRVFGELVALLVAEGNYPTALRLEEFWNELRRKRGFTLLCGYRMESFGEANLAEPLGDICAAHSRVVPAESYPALADSNDRLRAVAALQQRAASLEAEVARRQASEALLAGQSDVLAMIAVGKPLADILTALARMIEELDDDGIVCSVLVRDPDHEQFNLGIAPNLPESYISVLAHAPISPPYLGPCGQVAHLGEEVTTFDIATDQRWADEWRQLALSHGLCTCYSAPIMAADGSVLGSFGMYYRRPHDPKPASSRLVEIATYLAAIAIEQARVEARRQAEEALVAAEEAVRSREDFLSIASHELRNPIATVSGTVQLLRRARARGRLTDERLGIYIESLERVSSHLVTLTNDLLDVSRFQRGALPLRPELVDIVELLRDIVRRSEWPDHRVVLQADDGPLMATVDADRVRQVVSNLLSNAVKYSPSAEQVRVRLERYGDGVLIEVQDDGIGLPSGAAESIFTPFQRAPNAARAGIPGLGLGLFIARRIAEQHGGRLLAWSAGEGCGTTMSLRLPLRPQPAGELLAEGGVRG